jgi:hypothetical protein
VVGAGAAGVGGGGGAGGWTGRSTKSPAAGDCSKSPAVPKTGPKKGEPRGVLETAGDGGCDMRREKEAAADCGEVKKAGLLDGSQCCVASRELADGEKLRLGRSYLYQIVGPCATALRLTLLGFQGMPLVECCDQFLSVYVVFQFP